MKVAPAIGTAIGPTPFLLPVARRMDVRTRIASRPAGALAVPRGAEGPSGLWTGSICPADGMRTNVSRFGVDHDADLHRTKSVNKRVREGQILMHTPLSLDP